MPLPYSARAAAPQRQTVFHAPGDPAIHPAKPLAGIELRLSHSALYSLSGIIFLLTSGFSDTDNSRLPFVRDSSARKTGNAGIQDEKAGYSTIVS
jgi:hypothetical protein